MNFELYKPYKTRGGWKAVAVKIAEDLILVWHDNALKNLIWQKLDERRQGERVDDPFDLISEWVEPIKRTFWMVSDGKTCCISYYSERDAIEAANGTCNCEVFKLDYVQGATHYVAKGEE